MRGVWEGRPCKFEAGKVQHADQSSCMCTAVPEASVTSDTAGAGAPVPFGQSRGLRALVALEPIRSF